MTCLSDQGTHKGFYAVVNIDDHTRLILDIRVVVAARLSPPRPTPRDADDFDLSDPAPAVP